MEELGMLTKHLKYVLFFLLFFSIVTVSEATQCIDLLSVRAVEANESNSHTAEVSPFRKPRTLRVMSYNVQNLYVQKGRHSWGSEEELEIDPKIKRPEHTEEIAHVILETAPDIVVLQEIETYNSLVRFVDNFLGGEYAIFYAGDRDKREISTALLIKDDLDLHVRIKDTSGIAWKAASGVFEPVFSRELGAFEVFNPNTSEVVLGVFGVHFKSRLDRKNDPDSLLKRAKEAEVTARFVAQFEDANPNVPYIITGDFNDAPESLEFKPLTEGLDVFEPFKYPEFFTNKAGFGLSTFSIHPKAPETARYTSVDFFLTSRNLEEFVMAVDVYRYKNRATNTFKPLPTSGLERAENPSDHFPIFIDLKPDFLFSSNDENEGDKK